MISINLLERRKTSAKTSIRLNEIVKHIFKSKKATVLTGAGISCNAGIPDFRSSDGLYNMVKEKYPKSIVKGQDLFDVSLFRDEMSLSIFCTFMEGLYLSSLNANATETHKFIKTLKEKNKLLRCYTQNIDSLESSINLTVGVNGGDFTDTKKFAENWNTLDVVQLHGNLHKLACTICFSSFEWTAKYQTQLSQGLNPKCTKCYEKYQDRLYSGKRITGTIGLLRPDIVLYGENHPQSEILTQGLNVDIKAKPDLLLVMGTSLKVDGVKKLVKSLSSSIRARGGKVVYINKTPLSRTWAEFFDYEIVSDCDLFVKVLKKQVPDLFLTQEQLDSARLRNVKIKKETKKEVKKEIKKETKSIKKVNVTKKVTVKKEPLRNIDLNGPDLKQPLASELRSVRLEQRSQRLSEQRILKEVKLEKPKVKLEKSDEIVKPIVKVEQAKLSLKQHTASRLSESKSRSNERPRLNRRAPKTSERILTPPTTPTKKRKPALRRSTGSTIRGTSTYTLPSPVSSFSEGSSPEPNYKLVSGKPVVTRSQKRELDYDLEQALGKKIRVA